MTLERRSFPLVLAAPSGAGKTTLARRLVERNADLVFSISATTRPPRAGEVDARDYAFVEDTRFDRMIAAGDLLEWAVVHGRRYGTPRAAVERAIASGHVVVLDIDVQGARQVRQSFAEAVLVFVLPPSAAELTQRLVGRGSEPEQEQTLRLENALRELRAAPEFDYVVVNDDFEHAVENVEAIVQAERLRGSRISGLGARLDELGGGIRTLLRRNG